MPQFSESTVSSGAAITSTKINAVISAIGTAFNTLDSTNFSSATAVPNNALAAGNSYFTLQLNSASFTDLGASHSINNVLGLVVVPVAATLVSCKATADAITDNTDIDVDVYYEDGSPATILSATMDMSTDYAVVSGSLSKTAYAANDVLSLRCSTGAGDAIMNVCAVLTFKVAHTS